MRSWAFGVVALSLAACGRSGASGGLGTDTEGIQNNGVGANGCVAPSSRGYTDSRDALEHGATGDLCDFAGGSGDGTHVDFCMGNYLIIESETSQPLALCTPDGGSGPPTPVVTGPGCAESCFTSGGALDCIPAVVQAPNRQLPFSWSLNATTDCDALLSGCPQIGDPCTGSTICAGLWQPSTTVALGGENAVMWCEAGKLEVVINL